MHISAFLSDIFIIYLPKSINLLPYNPKKVLIQQIYIIQYNLVYQSTLVKIFPFPIDSLLYKEYSRSKYSQ